MRRVFSGFGAVLAVVVSTNSFGLEKAVNQKDAVQQRAVPGSVIRQAPVDGRTNVNAPRLPAPNLPGGLNRGGVDAGISNGPKSNHDAVAGDGVKTNQPATRSGIKVTLPAKRNSEGGSDTQRAQAETPASRPVDTSVPGQPDISKFAAAKTDVPVADSIKPVAQNKRIAVLATEMINRLKGEDQESVVALVQRAQALLLSEDAVARLFDGDKDAALAAVEQLVLSFMRNPKTGKPDPKAALIQIQTIMDYLAKGDAESIGAARGLQSLDSMYAHDFNAALKANGGDANKALETADAKWSDSVALKMLEGMRAGHELDAKLDDAAAKKKAEEATAALCAGTPPCAEGCMKAGK